MFSCLTHEEQEQVSRFFWRMQRRAIMELSGIYQEGPTSEEMVARSPEENLWRLLRRTNDIMVRVREKELSQYGLSIKMASALRVINMLGDRATPAAIARGRFRRPSTVSNLLMRMEKMGLIQKVPDRVKKNQIQVTLTEKGRRAYQQSREDTSVHRMFADLSTEDVKQFGAYLDELKIMAVREFDSHE